MASRMNPFELHIEKITLSVVVLALVGVGAWEFFLVDDTVKLAGRPTQISEIDSGLERLASGLRTGLQTPPGKDEFVAQAADSNDPTPRDLSSTLTASVVPQAATLTEPSFAALLVKDGDAREFTYHVPSLPAPKDVSVRSTFDAIDGKASDEFRKFFESRVSFPAGDVTWLTPAATLDPKAIRDELKRASEGESTIPSRWWDSSILIPDVVFERQEQNSDGTWSEPEQVAPMGTLVASELSFRNDFKAVPLASDIRETVIETLKQKEDQDQILRPDFYPTLRGNLVEPSFAEEAVPKPKDPVEAAKSKTRSKLASELTKLKRERDDVDKVLKDLGGPLKQSDADSKKKGAGAGAGGGEGGGGGGGGGFGGGFGGGGGMKGRRDPNAGDDEEKNKKRIQKTKELERLVKEIEDKTKALEALGGSAPAALQQEGFDLNGDTPVLMWTHDLDVEAGKTYRYRCEIHLLNPFLGKASVLNAAQQPLASKPVLASAKSDWSKPFTVPLPLEVFVTDARAGTRREADFEIYRLFGGEWRSAKFNILPGEVIGSTKKAEGGSDDEEVDFGTDWFLVDVTQSSSGTSRTDGGPEAADLVIIQNRSGKVIEYRVPSEDAASGSRASLSEQVKAAKAAAGSKPKPEAPPTDGGPAGPGGGPGA